MISGELYWKHEASNSTDQATRVRDAVNRAIPYLLQEQAEDGRWAGVLSSSPVTTALSLIAMQICDGARLTAQIQHGVDWLIAAQNPDGGWGELPNSSAVKSSILAISALHLIDSVRNREVIARGLACLERMGGWQAISPAYAPIAALAGLMPWDKTKEMPLELILWPKGLRKKTSFGLSSFLSVGLMRTHYVRLSLWRRPLRKLVRRRVISWLRQAQGPDGSFGETALLNSFVVVALTVAGISGEGVNEMLDRALAFVVEQQQPDGSFQADRDLEVFDTNNATIALAELGYNLKLPRFVRTRDWLLGAQTKTHCFSTDAPPGGWPWATPSGWPDSDDTSYALKALASLGVTADDPGVRAGVDWLLKMQNSDGSWSTFVKHSDAPFDQPCPYVTAHVLEGLWATGQFNANSRPVRRAIDWLQRAQKPDGTFTAIWFRNHTCGTASVLEALTYYGLANSTMARRCAEWLSANQNRDGSWSNALGQPGTAEETGWAISALLNAGVSPEDDSITRAIGWLLAHQDAKGGWQASVVGVYAATICYSNTLYPLCFPLRALAVYLKRTRGIARQQRSEVAPRSS